MNLSALDHCMFQMTDSEKRYLDGTHADFWSQVPTRQVNGRQVYYISDEGHHTESAVSDAIFPSNTIIGDTNLKVRRHSRFNPVPEHVHSYVELNYVYSGTCPQTINGQEMVLERNQVLLIDTECPHAISRLGEEDIMVSLMISKSFLRDHLFSEFSKDSILSNFFINSINEQTDHDHYLLFHSENDRRIRLFFQEFFCECFDPSINSRDILHHLFYVIMAELINVYENDLTHEQGLAMGTPGASIIRYIESNYKICSQTSVAEFFHISPNYVSLLLKRYTGMNYIQFVQEKRLLTAANLLERTSLSVSDVALEAGYENVSFFYRKFRQRFGCSPKEYQTAHAGPILH